MIAQPSHLDAILTALADSTRRAILSRVSRGEARVTEVAEPFQISLNAVSKHIRVLEEAGLVRRRRQGREHWISLDSEPLNEAADWFERQRLEWNVQLDALEVVLAKRRNQGVSNHEQ
jgi:DNA-binding transcriptional ArsR family regulator